VSLSVSLGARDVGGVALAGACLLLATGAIRCTPHGPSSNEAPDASDESSLPPLPPLPETPSDAACWEDAEDAVATEGSVTAGVGAWVTVSPGPVVAVTAVTAVLFGGVAGSIVGADDDAGTLTVVVPASARSGDLTFVAGCDAWISPGGFILDPVPAPVITSITPSTANVGTTVTLGGSYFTGAFGVSVGGTVQPFSMIDDATIVMQAATAGLSGPVGVTTVSGVNYSDAGLTISP
jgi:hypothetical protein